MIKGKRNNINKHNVDLEVLDSKARKNYEDAKSVCNFSELMIIEGNEHLADYDLFCNMRINEGDIIIWN